MWDVVTGTALWQHKTADKITALVLDPFDPQRMLVTSEEGWVHLLDNLGTDLAPKSSRPKFRLDSFQGQGATATGGGMSCHFSPHTRDTLMLVLPYELLVFDLRWDSHL